MINLPLNVLVVEDNHGDYILVREYLEETLKQASIYHADTLEAAIPLLEVQQIDVVLLDLTLPDSAGIDSFHSIYTKASKIPIIVLTGFGDMELALETLKLGAQDYIVKDDCNPLVLAKSIHYGIERSKIFDHLKKSEEQYKYLFYNNPLPMWAFEKNSFRFLMVNQAAVNHYGFSEEEFLKMTLSDIIVTEELEKLYQVFDLQQISETDLKYNIDWRHRKKDQTIIDVEVVTHKIITDGKEAVLSVINDVTERNKAKKQLHDSEEMFRTISENFPNGSVAILDKDLKVLYTAGKEFHIHGVAPAYFNNTIYTTHFDEATSAKVSEALHQVFNGNNTVFEVSHHASSYIISAVPLFEADKNITKILLASQNISERKRNEMEKELLIEELVQTNSDLRQFSYITSHNLRSPLSNLLGIIKLLDISTVTDPMTRLLIKNFKECTLQLNDTVNDLINVLIIKNNVNAKKEIINIDTVFHKVVASVQNTIDNYNAVIDTNFNPITSIEFNRSYLESILLNLLTNALKYSAPNRKPHLAVYTKNNNGNTQLYFADNGLGIDLDRYKDRIFGLYQRFHDHEDSKGLGLYMVNSQIRAMGGEIDVVSEVDKGTTFIITFKQ